MTAHHRQPEIPAARYRAVLGRFATGLTVVTAAGSHGPVGITVQSFMSVSLRDSLVAVAVGALRSWPVISEAGAFCVNLLAGDQEHLARTMATRGIDKFEGLDWRPSPATGSPLLPGTLGYVDCRIHDVHEAGDHHLVVGRVLDLDHSDREDALLYHRSRYGSTAGTAHRD